jgi:hypothetical protein
MHIRSGSFRSINHVFPYLGRGCIVILAMVFIVTAELSVSTSWSAASITAPSTGDGIASPANHLEELFSAIF